MKICHLCVLDFTLVNLLKNLIKETEKKGHEVITICEVNEHKEEVELNNLNTINFNISRSFNILKHLSAITKLTILFKKHKFDLVHFHTPIGSIVGRISAFFANQNKIIYTVHGFYFHENMNSFKKLFFFSIEYFLSKITDKILFQSMEDFNLAVKFKFGKKNNLFYIGNGIDLNSFNKKKYNKSNSEKFWKTTIGQNDVRKKILIIARLVKQKGILDIVKLAKKKSMQDKLFILVGSRNENEHDTNVETIIKTHQANYNNVLTIGYVSNVKDFYEYSDIFILPSYREGKPRSIIEAMAMKLPIIATNIRGSRELILDNRRGMLYQPGKVTELEKKINFMLSNNTEVDIFVKNSHEYARNFLDEKKVISKQFEILDI